MQLSERLQAREYDHRIVSIRFSGIELVGMLEGLGELLPEIEDVIGTTIFPYPNDYSGLNEQHLKNTFAGRVTGATPIYIPTEVKKFPKLDIIHKPDDVVVKVFSTLYLFTISGLGEFTGKEVQTVFFEDEEVFNAEKEEFPANNIAKNAITQSYDDLISVSEFKKQIKKKAPGVVADFLVNQKNLQPGDYTFLLASDEIIQFQVLDVSDDRITGSRNGGSSAEKLELRDVKKIYLAVPKRTTVRSRPASHHK